MSPAERKDVFGWGKVHGGKIFFGKFFKRPIRFTEQSFYSLILKFKSYGNKV